MAARISGLPQCGLGRGRRVRDVGAAAWSGAVVNPAIAEHLPMPAHAVGGSPLSQVSRTTSAMFHRAGLQGCIESVRPADRLPPRRRGGTPDQGRVPEHEQISQNMRTQRQLFNGRETQQYPPIPAPVRNEYPAYPQRSETNRRTAELKVRS